MARAGRRSARNRVGLVAADTTTDWTRQGQRRAPSAPSTSGPTYPGERERAPSALAARTIIVPTRMPSAIIGITEIVGENADAGSENFLSALVSVPSEPDRAGHEQPERGQEHHVRRERVRRGADEVATGHHDGGADEAAASGRGCAHRRTRRAYAEVLGDENAATAISFLHRAVAFFERHGMTVERVLTDNQELDTTTQQLASTKPEPAVTSSVGSDSSISATPSPAAVGASIPHRGRSRGDQDQHRHEGLGRVTRGIDREQDEHDRTSRAL